MPRGSCIVAMVVAACTTDLPAPADFAGPCESSPVEVERCVEQSRYEEDLAAFVGPRTAGDVAWQATQDTCFDRLESLGFETERQVYPTGVNVVGRKIGASLPDEIVLVAAHYDGVEGCPAVDDNASGVAGALEVARVLSFAEFDRTLVVACWDQEEAGLIGSRWFVTQTMATTQRIAVYFNFEMIGYRSDVPMSQKVPLGFDLLFPEAYAQVEGNAFRGDFIALVTDDLAVNAANALAGHASRIGLPAVVLAVPPELKNSPLLADLRRSDHAPFWLVDMPAMMITDTANFRNAAYHCGMGDDTIDRLDPAFATLVVRATAAAAAESLGIR